MNRSIQLDLPDALYNAIQRCAAALGSDAATVVTSALQQHFQTFEGPKAASGHTGGIEELFGSVDLGHPIGLDNESLDADLAREYARELEN